MTLSISVPARKDIAACAAKKVSVNACVILLNQMVYLFISPTPLALHVETPLCGETLFQTSGIIAIPTGLTTGTRCTWSILTDKRRKIALGVVNSFRSPEWRSNNCNTLDGNDNTTSPQLSIYDGENTSAPLLIGPTTQNGTTFHTVYSTDRLMYIEFIVQNTNSLPFLLSYQTFFEGGWSTPCMHRVSTAWTIAK